MGVLAIWRYPIKAMLGEALTGARLTRAGIVGDRRWVVVDRRTGERIANKRGRTDARLRACRAELGADAGVETEALRVVLPSGETACGDEIPDALSELLEVPVALEQATGEDASLGSPAAHHDFAPVHLLTNGTLVRLRAQEPSSDWDARRFRANLVLDDDGSEDFAEDSLIGSELSGRRGLRIRVLLPTPRCVVPTRAGEELPADPGVLRGIARRHRLDLGPFGRAACLGAYAEVCADGDVNAGEWLDVVAGLALPSDALKTTVDGLADRLI